MKIHSVATVALVAFTLSACASEPASGKVAPSEAPVTDQPATPEPEAPVEQRTEPVHTSVTVDAATPVEYGKDGLPKGAGLRFSLIEFSVPEKSALEASLLAIDEGRQEAAGNFGALYESLLASVRSGGSAVRVVSGRLTNGQAAGLKASSRLRYPTSYSQTQAMVAGISGEEITEIETLADGTKREKKTPPQKPAEVPPITLGFPAKSKIGPGYAITAGTPQDYEVQDIGLNVEVTPTLSEDGKTVYLELNPRRVTLDALPGETAEGGGDYPSQPRFSEYRAELKCTVRRGSTTFLSEIPPAPMSKEKLTTFLFVRVD